MHDVVLIKLVGCVVTAILAGAIFARDSGVRIHRLMGAVLASTSFWALCEVLWNLEKDPEVAVVYVRLSSLGWAWLGPVVLDIFLELGHRESRFRRLRPWAYGLTITTLPLYVLTPWSVESVHAVEWGWAFRFGPLFWLTYVAAALPPLLATCFWREIYPMAGSHGERRVSQLAFLSVATANGVASATDVGLPLLGVDFPPLGSTSISLAGLVMTFGLHRYGFSSLTPSAAASEILEKLTDGVAILEPGGDVRVSNEALARLVGTEPDALAGLPVAAILPGFEPGRGTLAGPLEQPALSCSGERIPVSVTSSLLHHDRGHVLGEVVVVRDLRELVVLRDRLVRSGRLAAVGELSTSIAHEIQQPVWTARSHLARLRGQWEGLCGDLEKAGRDDPIRDILAEGEELIEECLEGVDRVAGIVRDVGGLAPTASAERESAEPERLIENAVRIARSRAADGVELVCRASDVGDCWCNPSEITQVLLNLLLNAIQAVEPEGTVVCTTARRGDVVQIRVEDDGAGIAPEVRDRIFDPFFTTKPVGEGTGLGLAISLRIARAHGGELRVESEPGRGTAFIIELPVRPASEAAAMG